jgi:hypothetical protein
MGNPGLQGRVPFLGDLKMKSPRYPFLLILLACVVAPITLMGEANAQAKKPNILVIMTDDIGISNISAYTHG